MLTTSRLNDLSNHSLVRQTFARDGMLWDAWHSRQLKDAWELLVRDSRHKDVTFIEACGSPQPGNLRALMRLGRRTDYWGISPQNVEDAANSLRQSFIPFQGERLRVESLASMLYDLAYHPRSNMLELRWDVANRCPAAWEKVWNACMNWFGEEEEYIAWWWDPFEDEEYDQAIDIYTDKVLALHKEQTRGEN